MLHLLIGEYNIKNVLEPFELSAVLEVKNRK